MDIEDKKKINDILVLLKENNVYIKKIRKTQKNSQIFRAIYWVIILGLMISGYYFAQPYFKNVMNLYNGAMQSLQNFKSVGSLTK